MAKKEASKKKEIKEAKKQQKKAKQDEIKELKLKKKSTKDKKEKKNIKKEIKKVKNSDKLKGNTFIGEVFEEMKLVRWPSGKEVLKYSLASLIFVLVFALFFFGIDALFALVKDLIG